ncbi:inovirus-type Gp2 protein [Escherichia coli]|nr:inovirus-type Gp2 protein [Escherichia coli]
MYCNITDLVQETIQYKYIKSHGPLNKYQLKRIEQTIDKALDEYPRVMAIRVELHMPVRRPLCDMLLADDYARTDASAISRFNASLNAKIKHYELKQKKAGKRVRETSSRIVWAREFCPTNNKNTITFCFYLTAMLLIVLVRLKVIKEHCFVLFVKHG